MVFFKAMTAFHKNGNVQLWCSYEHEIRILF